MEDIFIWVLIILGFNFVKGIFFGGNSETEASFEALKGRLRKTHLASDDPHSSQRGPQIIAVQVKGQVDCNYVEDTTVITLAHDVTDPNNRRTLISHLSDFQEPGGFCYQYRRQSGPLDNGYGWNDWTQMSFMGLDIVSPPESGRRKIEFITWIIDTRLIPQYRNGFFLGEPPAVIWHDSRTMLIDFDHGYEEIGENEIAARQATIGLAVSVAMADGEMHDKEGLIIKKWMTEMKERYPQKHQEEAKTAFNQSFRKAYTEETQTGDILREGCCAELKSLGTSTQITEAVQLCYQVLGADGEAQSNELEQVKKISDSLGLDYSDIQQIKDRILINIETMTEDAGGIDAALGIDLSWSSEEILQHITKEWNKWNQAVATMPAGPKKDQARVMAKRYAEARKRYKK